MENWDEVWRRNQPVAAGFARCAPRGKLLFVGLTIDVSHLVRKLRFIRLFKQLLGAGKTSSPKGYDNIFLLNPLKLLPNTLTLGRLFNQWMERRQIRKACKRLGIEKPILWMNPYYALHLVGRMNEVASIYDVGDDWTSLSMKAWERRHVIAEDNALTFRADAVIVVSERLFAMKHGMNKRLHHIPNGVYAERYQGVAEHALPRHPITEGWPSPVLAYTGTVHKDRVNIDLVIAVARHFKDGTVALVGPIQVDEPTRKRLAGEPNIKMPGCVEFAEMPRVMSAFDACIVPHVVSPFTESLSPLKLYEYLASGLPTISTPVSGFRDFPNEVYLANSERAFIEAIEKGLAEPKEMIARRRAAVASFTWPARMDEIIKVLDSCLPERAAKQELSEQSVNAELQHVV